MIDYVTYEHIVRRLANSKSPSVSYNSGSVHSTVVMEHIFRTSTESVKIVTGHFHKDVCGDVENRFLESLEKYLISGGKLDVIMDNYSLLEDSNAVLSLLTQFALSPNYSSNIHVRTTNQKVRMGSREVHFMIGDERMYRLEYDKENFIAEFCFNDIETVKTLSKKFDILFESASEFPLKSLAFA
jgi:hypothetical protein